MQTSLFDSPQLKNGFRDSAFARNKSLPLHRWVPWIAGFSADFVDDCLGKYLPVQRKRAWVLDPFAGVGTTLVQAYLRGFNVVGFEINPYAALATNLKLEARRIQKGRLEGYIADFESFMEAHCSDGKVARREPESVPPTGFSGRTKLFSPKIERKILFAIDYVNSISEHRVRDLFRLALGSVMVSVSNYSYEPSLTRRASVGKPEIQDAPVGPILSAKLHLMLQDIEWFQRQVKNLSCVPQAKVVNASIFTARETLRRERFVDAVITSPPYLNNYHYPRNTRPQLYWLGFSSGRGYGNAGEQESFGKFWQTVREQPPIGLSFQLPRLERILTSIRGLNTEKGIYGGAGWANYVATYFNDTYRFCELLTKLLKPDGVAVIVLGNSIIQGFEVKTDYFFGRIAQLCGLSCEHRFLLRKKRTGTSIIRSSVRVDKAKKRTVLYESAIILKK